MQKTPGSTPGTFQIFDLALSSEIAFPELRAVPQRRPDLRIVIDRRMPAGAACPHWIRHYANNGDPIPWLSVGLRASDYILRFPSIADVRVSPRGRVIRCAAEPDVAPNTLRHTLLDQVIPLVLSTSACTVLHASAVLTGNGAVAFIGESGVGKSTLAASLASAGHAVVTDDSLLVRVTPAGPEAVPSYPGLRLWPDAIIMTGASASSIRVRRGATKRRVGRRSDGLFPSSPAPLRTIYVLEPRLDAAAHVASTPITSREALFALLGCSFRLDVPVGAPLVAEFDRLSGLAQAVRFRQLSYPKRPESLSLVRQIIERDD